MRRYGATVVFYAGEMCRALVDAPHSPGDRNNPVRLFAGSGMRADVWRRLVDRFGPLGVLEFYASTEGNAVLANAAGDKVGALGRPLPGSSELALVNWDPATRQLARDDRGRCATVDVDQPGMLLARIDDGHPLPAGPAGAGRVARDVFATGDSWFVTGDLLRRDPDGDYWFVGRGIDTIPTAAGPAYPFGIEDALYQIPGVALAVAYGVTLPGSRDQVPVAAVVLRPGIALDRAATLRILEASLPRHAWPRFIRRVGHIPMTPGYRPLARELAAEGLPRAEAGALRYDAERHAYLPLDDDGYRRTLQQLGARA